MKIISVFSSFKLIGIGVAVHCRVSLVVSLLLEVLLVLVLSSVLGLVVGWWWYVH